MSNFQRTDAAQKTVTLSAVDLSDGSKLPKVLSVDSSGNPISAAAALSIANTMWTDGTNFYVRREVDSNGTFTVSWENLDGSAAVPTLANLKLASSPILGASEAHIGAVGGAILNPSASFTRPANTTAYASGQLVANNAAAGSVAYTALTVARVSGGSFMLRRVKLKKSNTSLTNAQFRVHFYTSTPTFSNGDGAAWLTTESGYLGSMDITMDRAFSDSAAGFGVPNNGFDINALLASGTTIAWALEARAAYTPASAEVFTLTVEDWVN